MNNSSSVIIFQGKILAVEFCLKKATLVAQGNSKNAIFLKNLELNALA